MRVRPLDPDDITSVALLHRATFGGDTPDATATPGLEAYLQRIFCDHPWPDPELPSLVCQDGSGEIVGCLGVMPRPMRFGGEPLRTVVFHDFMVAPEHRSSLVAIELAKRGLAGPQELSVADGNDASRRILESFGAQVVTARSLRWIRPLRPLGSASRLFLDEDSSPGGIVRRLCGAADAIASRLPGLSLRPSRPETTAVALTVEALLEELAAATRSRSLVPAYDAGSLAWLLETLEASERAGSLRRALVQKDGSPLGWYLYYARRGGVGEVVQIGARRGSTGEVLRHLFADAWEEGLVAVSGQLVPSLVDALSEHRCFFDHAGFWLLARSDRADVLQALHRDDAFLGRLEGEGWLRLAF